MHRTKACISRLSFAETHVHGTASMWRPTTQLPAKTMHERVRSPDTRAGAVAHNPMALPCTVLFVSHSQLLSPGGCHTSSAEEYSACMYKCRPCSHKMLGGTRVVTESGQLRKFLSTTSLHCPIGVSTGVNSTVELSVVGGACLHSACREQDARTAVCMFQHKCRLGRACDHPSVALTDFAHVQQWLHAELIASQALMCRGLTAHCVRCTSRSRDNICCVVRNAVYTR